MKLTEETLSKNYIYKGKIINLRVDDALLPDGKTAKREIVEHNGGVCVAAVTENDEILLVKQFRYPYGEIIYEIPAGKRDGDEDPLLCGKRELREETGAEAKTYMSLGLLYPTPGYCGEIIWLFAAKDITFGQNNPDEDEFVEVEKVPFKKAVDMVMNGEIRDAKTQTAILKLNELRRNGKF